MRDTFVRTLITLAKSNPNIELFTGDLGFGKVTSHFPHYLAPEIIKRNKYGTDNYRNKRLLGVEKAGQHAGRTDGRLPEKDCPVCAGQVNGCAGRM